MKKFDISWKGILLAFIVLTFLLSGLDMIVHGETLEEDDKRFISRWDKVQSIEDRYEKILKEEGEEVPYTFIWGISREFKTSDYSTYKYTKYVDDKEICRGYKTLPNRFVDIVYAYSNIDDEEWITMLNRMLESFEIRL